MNPAIALLKAILAVEQPRGDRDLGALWQECVMTLWGQCVGVLVCIVYCMSYLPKRAPPPMWTAQARL